MRPLAAELGAMSSGAATSPSRDDRRGLRRGREALGQIDFVVHCLAFSDKDQLDGRYVDTTAENFTQSLLISCYSFTALAQRAEKLMTDGGSHANAHLLRRREMDAALQCHGRRQGRARSLRALPRRRSRREEHPGERHLGGADQDGGGLGIGDFRYILRWNEYNAPMRRVVTIEEVGESAVYLLSPMSRGVSGEMLHVDAGYHVVGMMHPAAAPKMADLLALLPQHTTK